MLILNESKINKYVKVNPISFKALRGNICVNEISDIIERENLPKTPTYGIYYIPVENVQRISITKGKEIIKTKMGVDEKS